MTGGSGLLARPKVHSGHLTIHGPNLRAGRAKGMQNAATRENIGSRGGANLTPVITPQCLYIAGQTLFAFIFSEVN